MIPRAGAEVEREGRHLKSVSVRLVVSGDLIRVKRRRAPVSVKSSLGFARADGSSSSPQATRTRCVAPCASHSCVD